MKPFLLFVNERIIEDKDAHITPGEFNNEYNKWCDANDFDRIPVNKRVEALSESFKSYDYTNKRLEGKPTKVHKCIRWKTIDDMKVESELEDDDTDVGF